MLGRGQNLFEIASLARALDFNITGQVTQSAHVANFDSYLGPGALQRLDDYSADFIIANDSLTPRQINSIQGSSGKVVYDRAAVILNLFAKSARSKAGLLQVELARAKYDLAFARGFWTHLERQRGGHQNKGSGERQREEDTRQLGRKIKSLEKKLLDVRPINPRSAYSVALVGYTNAGKSSLLSSLSASSIDVSPRPFETLDPLTRRIETARGEILLSDTVGFVSLMPPELIAAFHSTLDEVRRADLILHVHDASSIYFEDKRQVVLETLRSLGVNQTARLDILTKSDQNKIPPSRLPHALRVSSRSGQGLSLLKQTLCDYRDKGLSPIDIVLPETGGPLLEEIARADRGLSIESCEKGLRVKALLSVRIAQKLFGAAPPSNNTLIN